MLRLTNYDDDAPETFLFPVAEARAMATRVEQAPAQPGDRGACDAARRVEDALRDVELKFERLRDLMGYGEPDPDRPRAA
jgi:hypothetical protein